MGVFSPLRKFPASTVIDKQLGITENGCELAPQAVGEELGVEVPLPWTGELFSVGGSHPRSPRVVIYTDLVPKIIMLPPHPGGLLFVKCVEVPANAELNKRGVGENNRMILALESGAHVVTPSPRPSPTTPFLVLHSNSWWQAQPGEHGPFLLQVLRTVPREWAAGHTRAQ